MLIEGQELKSNLETVVIPRGNGKDIIIKCGPVDNFDEFDKLIPDPLPPKVIRRGSETPVPNFDDDDYKKAVDDKIEAKFAYIMIKSISYTPGLKFEKVKPLDPSTWGYLRRELNEAGFSAPEINMIYRGCLSANCLDQDKLDEARESFTRSQAQRGKGA